MFLTKLPEGYQYGLMITNGTGRQLDMLGQTVGLRRRILEPDVIPMATRKIQTKID